MMSSAAPVLASCLSATVDQSCHIIVFTLLMLVLVVKVRTSEEAAFKYYWCTCDIVLLNFAVKQHISLLPKCIQLAQRDNCDWWVVLLQTRVEWKSV